MVKRKRGFSEVHYAIFALIFMLIMTGSSRFTGMAVTEQDSNLAMSLAGDWNVSHIIYLKSCDDIDGRFSYILPVTASEGNLNIFFPELEWSGSSGRIIQKSALIKATFTSGQFAFVGRPSLGVIPPAGGTGEVTLNLPEMIPSSDCNSFTLKSNWDYRPLTGNADDACSGTMEIIANKKNLDGCFKPVCKENWSCSDWSVCDGGTQSRTCSDSNSCNTNASKPALSQSCTAPIPATPEVPAASETNYSLWIILVSSILAIGLLSTFFAVQRKKKSNSTEPIYQLIGEIRSSISIGDRSRAVNGYIVLTEQFSLMQSRIPKEDSERIYQESLNLHRDISAMGVSQSQSI